MIQGMTNVATVLKSDEITNKDVKAAAVAAGDSACALPISPRRWEMNLQQNR